MQMMLFSMPLLTPSLDSQAVTSTDTGLSRCDAKPDGTTEQLAACILPLKGLCFIQEGKASCNSMVVQGPDTLVLRGQW